MVENRFLQPFKQVGFWFSAKIFAAATLLATVFSLTSPVLTANIQSQITFGKINNRFCNLIHGRDNAGTDFIYLADCGFVHCPDAGVDHRPLFAVAENRQRFALQGGYKTDRKQLIPFFRGLQKLGLRTDLSLRALAIFRLIVAHFSILLYSVLF